MKLGILNAINPLESEVNWGGSPIDAYIRFLRSTGAEFEFAGYEVAQGQLPASPAECDAYVITGSPRGAYDSDPWISELIQFIRAATQAGRKFVGICFGHQVLAQALGGHVEKSEKGWGLGLKSLEVSQAKPWMNGQQQQVALYFAHQDQVIQLPPGAELLGGSEFCPIGMYTIQDQIFGIQGHPEFSRSIMSDILNRQKTNGDVAVATAAEASLESGTADGRIVAEWIVNFLGS
jgi:GMP synthase-like glutamine amidotransferase